ALRRTGAFSHPDWLQRSCRETSELSRVFSGCSVSANFFSRSRISSRKRRTMMHLREVCLVAIALLLAWLIWYAVWESYGDDGIDLMLGYVTAAGRWPCSAGLHARRCHEHRDEKGSASRDRYAFIRTPQNVLNRPVAARCSHSARFRTIQI